MQIFHSESVCLETVETLRYLEIKQPDSPPPTRESSCADPSFLAAAWQLNEALQVSWQPGCLTPQTS